MFKEWGETRLIQKKKVSPLGLPQRDPHQGSLFFQGATKSFICDRERCGKRRMGGREKEMMDRLWNLCIILPPPPCGLPLLPFQSSRLAFQWEGLRFTNVPREIFCSSSIGESQRHLEPRVLTGTGNPDPHLSWVPSAAMKGKDLDVIVDSSQPSPVLEK